MGAGRRRVLPSWGLGAKRPSAELGAVRLGGASEGRGWGGEADWHTPPSWGYQRVETVPLAAGATWRAAGRGTGFFAA